MSVKPTLLAVSVVILAACGPEAHAPEEWMYGTFSYAGNVGQTLPNSNQSLQKFRFEREGIAKTTRLSSCGEDGGSWDTEYAWEARDSSSIVVVVHATSPNADEEWRFTRDGGCMYGSDTIRWETVHRDNVTTDFLIRGDMCLERFDCNDTDGNFECDECRTVWCDEAPPPCADG